MGEPAAFSVTGLTLPEDEDPLGVWALHRPEPGFTSFALDGEGAPGGEDEGLHWHVELPASFKAARPQLRRRMAEVQRRLVDLERVEHHLENLEPDGGAGVTAFSLQGGAQMPSGTTSPEDELLAVVDALGASPGMRGSGPATAFALGEGATPLQRRLFDEARAIFDQFKTLVANFASVETEVEGEGVAVTTVDWTGDFQTAWEYEAKSAEMTLHRDAVRLAVASRMAWLKLMGVVVAGALGLAVKAAVPGGQLLLVPAVYKYVREMLKQWRQFQDVGAGS